MIPTFTDAAASPTVRSLTSFRRSLAITVAMLIVLGGGLTALNYFQGPKLTGGAIDTSLVVAQTGQQLRLFTNEQIATVTPGQVSVTPAAPHTVSTSGQVIALQFSHRLRYSTRYTVTITGATSIYERQPARLSYGFTTAAASIAYLQRASPESGGPDQIFRTGLRGNSETLVFSGQHIEEFALFPAAAAIVAAAPDGSSTLSLESLSGDRTDPILLPGTGIISHLQSNPVAGLVAFEFTGGSYDHTLFTVDLTAAHTATAVRAADGQPLKATRWNFVGSSTVIAALTRTGTIETVDVSVPGGRPAAGTAAQPGQAAHVADPLTISEATPSLRALIIAAAAGGQVNAIALSPNGQYLAVTVTPAAATSVSDNYPVDAQSTSVSTVFVEVATGLTVRSVGGFAVAW